MTQNEDDRESTPNEPDGQNDALGINRWGRFREFMLARPKWKKVQTLEDRDSNASDLSGISRASRFSRFSDYSFRRKHKHRMQANKYHNTDGTGYASKSSRRGKRTMTFSGMFSRGKEEPVVEEVVEKPEDDLVTMQPPLEANSSLTVNHQVPKEETHGSISKSDKLRSIKESDANRTMIFSSDLSPCSPPSTKGSTSTEAEAYIGSRKSDESQLESGLNLDTSNGETFGQKDEKQNDTAFGSGTHCAPTSTRVSETMDLQTTLLNMRLGSIVVGEEGVALPLKSSPLPSPRSTHGRSSGSPKHIVRSLARSRSAPEETYNGTKNAVRNDHESPWGVKDMGESDNVFSYGESRQLSKRFRVSGIVNGLKGQKLTHHSSSSLNHTDDEIYEGHDIPEPLDMMEDEFVNFSVKQRKNNSDKGNRSWIRRGRWGAAPMH